jgi:hypothetical protein
MSLLGQCLRFSIDRHCSRLPSDPTVKNDMDLYVNKPSRHNQTPRSRAGWGFMRSARAPEFQMTAHLLTTVYSPALHQTALRVTRRLTRRSLSSIDATG